MALIHMTSFTVTALAVGSAVVGSSLLDRTQPTQASTTLLEVRHSQCVPTQDKLTTEQGNALAVHCQNAYSAGLQHAGWPALFHSGWR